jgi:hypothetical protein
MSSAGTSLLAECHARMSAACATWRLPLRSRTWRGQSGNWSGAGIGSSIDFQDHRPYFPGDDPRYIDWQAFARSEHYTMKLYRAEVSPAIDVAMDVSQSMFFDDAKARRAWELFYFAVESALQAGGSLRCFFVGNHVTPLAIEQVFAHEAPPAEVHAGQSPPRITAVPWRGHSLRIWVSDLLFPGDPSAVMAMLSGSHARALVLAPWCNAEAEPGWDGNIELLDCETAEVRHQRVGPDLLRRYCDGYKRHFELWRDAARKFAAGFCRVHSDVPWDSAMEGEPLTTGAVELH